MSSPFARFAAFIAFGQHGIERLDAGACPACGSTDQHFRDAIAHREHEIGGLCQECQDKWAEKPPQ